MKSFCNKPRFSKFHTGKPENATLIKVSLFCNCQSLRSFTIAISGAAWFGLGCRFDLHQTYSQKLHDAEVLAQPGVETRLPHTLDDVVSHVI